MQTLDNPVPCCCASRSLCCPSRSHPTCCCASRSHVAAPRNPMLLPLETPGAVPRNPWCCASKPQVCCASKPLGTNFETKIFKFWWFLGPPDQNELYHTPLLSKMWDIGDRNFLWWRIPLKTRLLTVFFGNLKLLNFVKPWPVLPCSVVCHPHPGDVFCAWCDTEWFVVCEVMLGVDRFISLEH